MKDRVNVACGCYLCDPVARKRDHRDRRDAADLRDALDEPRNTGTGKPSLKLYVITYESIGGERRIWHEDIRKVGRVPAAYTLREEAEFYLEQCRRDFDGVAWRIETFTSSGEAEGGPG